MELDALMHELSAYKALPKAAIREATERRAEVAPRLIATIEAFIDTEDPSDEQCDALLLAFHMLGSWRETSAYRAVARLLRRDSEKLEAALGDAKTETGGRVMLNLFDGDPTPLYEIIESETADPYIRGDTLHVVATLAEQRRLSKDEVASYLRRVHSKLPPQMESWAWNGWVNAIALLGIEDMTEQVRKVCEAGLTVDGTYDFKEFRNDLKSALGDPSAERLDLIRVDPFGDTIEELSQWHGFTEKGIAERRRAPSQAEGEDRDHDLEDKEDERDFFYSEPVTNPFRNVGRNDPCPCGSGKKFKKCCLGKAA